MKQKIELPKQKSENILFINFYNLCINLFIMSGVEKKGESSKNLLPNGKQSLKSDGTQPNIRDIMENAAVEETKKQEVSEAGVTSQQNDLIAISSSYQNISHNHDLNVASGALRTAPESKAKKAEDAIRKMRMSSQHFKEYHQWTEGSAIEPAKKTGALSPDASKVDGPLTGHLSDRRVTTVGGLGKGRRQHYKTGLGQSQTIDTKTNTIDTSRKKGDGMNLGPLNLNLDQTKLTTLTSGRQQLVDTRGSFKATTANVMTTSNESAEASNYVANHNMFPLSYRGSKKSDKHEPLFQKGLLGIQAPQTVRGSVHIGRMDMSGNDLRPQRVPRIKFGKAERQKEKILVQSQNDSTILSQGSGWKNLQTKHFEGLGSSINSFREPRRNISVKPTLNVSDLPDPFSVKVLFNPQKNHRTSQHYQLNNLFKKSIGAMTYDLKNEKHTVDLPRSRQLGEFRDQLSDFYKNPKVETITEDQVRSGLTNFDVLVLPTQLEAMQAASEKIKLEQVKQREQKKADEELRLMQAAAGSKVNLQSKKLSVQEIQKKAENGLTIGDYMMASIIEKNDDVENIKGLDGVEDKRAVAKKLEALEVKEIGIIQALYEQHFSETADGKIVKKQVLNEASEQTLELPNSQQTVPTEEQRNSYDDNKDRVTHDSQRIITEYQTKANDLSQSQDLKAAQEVKYVQYIPNKFGNKDMNLDKAIKLLYSPRYTNISQDPALRTRVTSPNQSYLYGKHERQCQTSHVHSKNCSKVKDFDLAELQSTAFQYMVLQKPQVELGAAIEGKPIRASFFPSAKMPQELQAAFDESKEFRKLMHAPDKKIELQAAKKKVFDNSFDQRMLTTVLTEEEEQDLNERQHQTVNDQQGLLQKYSKDKNIKVILSSIRRKGETTAYHLKQKESMKSHHMNGSKVSSGHTSQIKQPAQRKVIDVVKKQFHGESPRNSMLAGDEISPLNSDAGIGIETNGPTYEPETTNRAYKNRTNRSPSNPNNNSKDGISLSKNSCDQDETSHIVLVSADKTDQQQSSNKFAPKLPKLLDFGTLNNVEQMNSQGESRSPSPDYTLKNNMVVTEGSRQVLSTSIEVETPMSNTSIRKHMQEQQRLQNIYLNFKNHHDAQIKQAAQQKGSFEYPLQPLLQMQLLQNQLDKQRCLIELAHLKAEIKNQAQANMNQNLNKKTWKSPFVHRLENQSNKQKNLAQSQHRNLEKSVNVANNTSIYYAKANLKTQNYHQWSLKALFKRQEELNRQYMQYQFQERQILQAQYRAHTAKNYQMRQDLQLSAARQSDGNTTNNFSVSPTRLNNKNIYQIDTESLLDRSGDFQSHSPSPKKERKGGLNTTARDPRKREIISLIPGLSKRESKDRESATNNTQARLPEQHDENQPTQNWTQSDYKDGNSDYEERAQEIDTNQQSRGSQIEGYQVKETSRGVGTIEDATLEQYQTEQQPQVEIEETDADVQSTQKRIKNEMSTPPPASDKGTTRRKVVDVAAAKTVQRNKDLPEDIPDHSNANQDSQRQLLQSQSSQYFAHQGDLLSSYTKKKHSMRPKISSPMKDPSKDRQPHHTGGGSMRASNPSMPSRSSPHYPVKSFRSGRRDVDPNLLQLTDRTSGSNMVSGGSSHVKSNVSPPTVTIGKSANKRKEGGSPSQKSKKKKAAKPHLNKNRQLVNDLAHMELNYHDGIDQEDHVYFHVHQQKLQLTNKTNTLSQRDQETLMMQKKVSQGDVNDPHSGRDAMSPVTPQTQLMQYQSKSPTETNMTPANYKPQLLPNNLMIESLHENEDAQTSPIESGITNTRGPERKLVQLDNQVEKPSTQPQPMQPVLSDPSITPKGFSKLVDQSVNGVQILVSSTGQHSARATNASKKPPQRRALPQRRFEIADTPKESHLIQNTRILRGQQKKRI